MRKCGSYNVNRRRREDTSFKNFICALLVFLAVLILISLLIWFFGKKRSENDDLGSKTDDRFNYEFLNGNISTNKQNQKLIETTPKLVTTTTQLPTTPSLSTNRKESTTAGDSRNTSSYSSTTAGYPTTTTGYPGTTAESPGTTTDYFRPIIGDSSTTTDYSSINTEHTKTYSGDSKTTTDDSSNTSNYSSGTAGYPSTTTDNSGTTTSSGDSKTTTEVLSTNIYNGSITTEESTTTNNTTDDSSAVSTTTTTIITSKIIYPDSEVFFTPISDQTTPVPTTCKNGICKRAASEMLAKMNHDDTLNRCEDYYKFICQGSENNDNRAFFRSSFNGFIKKINEVNTTSEKSNMQAFADFYKSCNDFGKSINRLDRLYNLWGTEGVSLTDSVATAILAQTLPFFDIGLNIKGSKFMLEINLPGLSYLKTTLNGWSLIEQLTDVCINKQSDKIDQNILKLDKISTDINTCIEEMVQQYVKNFVREMKQLSGLSSSFEFLNATVKAASHVHDLMEILHVVQESLGAYRNSNSKKLKETTLLELKTNYDLGIDWIELFKNITNDLVIDENTVVYQSEHLEEVFKKLNEKKAHLQPLVDLWHNIELYKNIVLEKGSNNSGFKCLEMTSQLMPEVSSATISELNADKKDFYKVVQSLTEDLTNNVYSTLVHANMTLESAKIIQERLSRIAFTAPQATSKSVDQDFNLEGPFPKKIVDLISHFRKTLFSMHDNIVHGDLLLKYFVNAFSTRPKYFPSSRTLVVQPGFFYGKSTKLPTYSMIAKLGLPIAMEISRYFGRNDFAQPQEQKDVYDELEKTFGSKNLMNKINYTLDNVDVEVEDGTGNHLSHDIWSDNFAFNLVTDTFSFDRKLEYLPFLRDFTREQSFVIIALQEYCKRNTKVDFIGDYYNGHLPVPIKFRNMLKNSEFYSKAFNCNEPLK